MADEENKSTEAAESSQAESGGKLPAKADKKTDKPKKAAHAKRKKHKKAKKPLWKSILTHPVTWIILAIIAMILFINHFERYTQIGVNTTYKIF